jgi:hypothetical protein
MEDDLKKIKMEDDLKKKGRELHKISCERRTTTKRRDLEIRVTWFVDLFSEEQYRPLRSEDL